MDVTQVADAVVTWAAMYFAWRAANDRWTAPRRSSWLLAIAWLISMVAIAL
jgi:hypothetical protein